MVTFSIIGAGWRAAFYIRIARALPEYFTLAGVYARREERARELEAQGIRVFRSEEELLSVPADFLVSCVSKASMGETVLHYAGLGLYVLSETPLGYSKESLDAFQNGLRPDMKIQIAEQYPLQPRFAAVKAVIDSGLLGKISQVQLSACHDYHAAALIAFLLGTGNALPRVTSFLLPDRVLQYEGRPGRMEKPICDSVGSSLAILHYGDKVGLYDFCRTQYFSEIRRNTLKVRGEKGEICQNEVTWLEGSRPRHFVLERNMTGLDGNLGGFSLEDISGNGKTWYTSPFPRARLSDEELAIATVLQKMGNYATGGESFYSIEEALRDVAVALEFSSGGNLSGRTK